MNPASEAEPIVVKQRSDDYEPKEKQNLDVDTHEHAGDDVTIKNLDGTQVCDQKGIESDKFGFLSEDDEDITPASLKNEYHVINEIGRGSQGKLYKAVRLSDNKTVVIKQLNINSIKTWKEYELFHREAETLSRLNISGVAAFYDAIDCLDDNPPCSYIVQEFIPGISLQQMIQMGHRFRTTDVYDILIQTLSILQKLHAHEPPVIHRDIKPSNLMITTDAKGNYHVTVIDFGAVANPQVQGGGSTVAGTFGYMPPEQMMGKPEPASDIYSVAALAVQLFSGKSPADIPVKEFRLIFEPEMKDKPYELVNTLRRMLEPKLEQRLSDVDEIIRLFKNYKDNIFEHKANVKHRIGYEDSYERELKKLECLCESGSFELWQRLHDGERALPEAYRDYINEYMKILGKVQPKRNANIEIDNLTKTKNSITGYVMMTAIIVMIGGVVGNALEVRSYRLVMCAILFACWLVMMFVIYFLKKRGSFSHQNRVKNISGFAALAGYEEHYDMMKSVFSQGRKEIGTVVDVTYLPVSSIDVKLNAAMVKKMNRYNRVTQSYAECFKPPTFRVTYSFNPPDDKRSEDIIHSFETYTEPDNHYKAGDPIPILYTVQDRGIMDVVYSMPYPVPVKDLENRLVDLSNSLSVLKEDENSVKYFLMDVLSAHGNTNAIKKALSDMPYLKYPKSVLMVAGVLDDYLFMDDYEEIDTNLFARMIRITFRAEFVSAEKTDVILSVYELYQKFVLYLCELMKYYYDYMKNCNIEDDNYEPILIESRVRNILDAVIVIVNSGYEINDLIWDTCFKIYEQCTLDDLDHEYIWKWFYDNMCRFPDKYLEYILLNCTDGILVECLNRQNVLGMLADKILFMRKTGVLDRQLTINNEKVSVKEYIIHRLLAAILIDNSMKCLNVLQKYYLQSEICVDDIGILIQGIWYVRCMFVSGDYAKAFWYNELHDAYFENKELKPYRLVELLQKVYQNQAVSSGNKFVTGKSVFIELASWLPTSFLKKYILGSNLSSEEMHDVYANLYTNNCDQNDMLIQIHKNVLNGDASRKMRCYHDACIHALFAMKDAYTTIFSPDYVITNYLNNSERDIMPPSTRAIKVIIDELETCTYSDNVKRRIYKALYSVIYKSGDSGLSEMLGNKYLILMESKRIKYDL